MQACDVNIDPAQSNNYKVIFSRLPNVVFMCQKVTIPGVSTPTVSQANPFNAIPQTGDHLSYEKLTLEFIVNEDYSNWLEVLKWQKGLAFPENFDQFEEINNSDDGLYSDCSVILMNGTSNPTKRLVYKDVLPVYLSGFMLDSAVQQSTIITASATFEFTTFNIEKI
jgi:hypothetical protein